MSLHQDLIKAFKDIPLIKEGKADVNALLSFSSDVKCFHNLVSSCEIFPEKRKLFLNNWQLFIKMRNDEDFIPHNLSKNALIYKTLFDWRLHI